MAAYNVYGVGNALVDIEYTVTPDQLQDLGIEKGVMTLVDAEQQNQVIACLGEQLKHRGSGGSAANTIIALCQLGGKAFYSCRVGNDEMGRFYLEDLARAGVKTSIDPQALPEGITGTCLVLVTPDADRTMNTFLGASADISPADGNAAALADAEYVYLEGYLVTSKSALDAALAAAQEARDAEKKIAFSLSDPNIVKYCRAGVLQLVEPGVDLLFANEDEALELTGAAQLREAIEKIKKYAHRFVITRGAEGAVAFDGESEHSIQAVSTEPVDTVGAGDMFAGAFLYGITHDMDFPTAGRLAAMAASRIVSSMGPRLTHEQMQELFAKFQ